MIKNDYYKMTNISEKVVRRDYSKIKTDFVAPNLLDIQINSYKKFLDSELENVIRSISPIYSPQDKYTLKVNKIIMSAPKKTEEEAREDAKTYDAALYVDIVITDNETGEELKPPKKSSKSSAEEGVFLANIPIMTEKGTFIINGIEKFVIAQIARSPGVYALTKSQIKLNVSRKKVIEGSLCEVLPFKGTLMIIYPNEDKELINIVVRDTSGETAPVFNITEFLKAFGLSSEEIANIFANDDLLLSSLHQCSYQASNVFLLKELQDLKTSIQTFLANQVEPEQILEKLFQCHKLERKLKELVFNYVMLENKIDELKQNNGDKSELTALVNNKDILIKHIISEKAAKDIVKKMSISAKVFDNNNVQVEENKISYQTLLQQHFCSEKYYDLTDAGRYKLNRKLRISERIFKKIIAEDIKDMSGSIVFKKGTLMDKQNFDKFKSMSQKRQLDIFKKINIIEQPSELLFGKDVNLEYETIKIYPSADDLSNEITTLIGVNTDNKNRQINLPDLIATISYVSDLTNDLGEYDDIDHLGNKRLKLIHELLKSKINAAMLRIEKYIKEKLAIIDGTTNAQEEELEEDQKKKISFRQIVNTKPFQLAMKDFFNSHQLTQFIDQQNPLSELTNKRRISAMGPGGISREDPNLDIRDVHYSHYGRICPIETPEGMNIGLVMSLASFTTVDDKGFLLTPYRKVNNGVITNDIRWMVPSQDDEYIISESNVKVDEKNAIAQDTVVARYRGISDVFSPKEVDYIDILPKQVVSIAASAIPFLENNDANRALMGSNMQRQATPLIKPYAPIVGTGSEYKIAHDSGMAVISKVEGEVTEIDGNHVVVKLADGTKHKSRFTKFKKTNQDTCNNQTPIVELGEKIKVGQTICDGPAMKNGELALGQNVLVAFTTWSGFNYEDAIILSERLVKEDIYTSISIDEYTVKCLETKNGDEEITRDIPNVPESAKKYLTESGVIMVGAEVKEGDILVGKITPKGHVDLSPEEKLLQAIFGEKTKPIKDSSLRVPHSGEGIVAAVKSFRIDDDNDLGDDVIEIVKVYVIQKRKIQIGDKMAGRHGNKGIISKIVPIEDMPHLEDGTPVDVMLNPLGVPSRMNIGQILEIHLGLAAREIAKKEVIKLTFSENDWMPLVKLFSLKEHNAQRLYETMKSLYKAENIKSEAEALTNIKTIDLEIVLRKVGLSYDDIGYKVCTPVFAGCTSEDLEKTMIEAGIDPVKTQGKFKLIDGRTGESFDGPISIGIMYMLKLDHMVDDKIHARSVGSYSKITQQPLGGKSQNGGQRFGEMEVWALEAYGASHNLREILTIKSDDVKGRNKTYNAIIKGKDIPSGCMPESFKLLVKQLQGLCLGTSILDAHGNEQDTNEYIRHENLILSSEYDVDTIEALNQYSVDDEDIGFTRPVDEFSEDNDE